MMRPFLKYMLAGIFGLVFQALPVLSQSTTEKPAAPALSDTEVLHYLSYSQRQQWDDAQKKITDGQSMIDNGNWLLQTKQPPDSPDLHVADAHAAGKQQVADGTASMVAGQQVLATLRHAAQLAAVNSKSVSVANTFQIVLPSAQWPDVVQHMSDALMKSLWAANYTQIYLSDVFSYDKTIYEAKPDLTDEVRDALMQSDALLQSDANHRTLIPSAGSNIKLMRQNGALAIDYPDRASTSNTRCALVVGEILNIADTGYVYFSLRAVDIVTGKILHNELVLLSIEPELGKGLGLVAFQVPSARITPATGNATVPAPDNGSVTITLQDTSGILSSFNNAAHPYVFRADTAGSIDTPENRVAMLLAKSILLKKPNLTVTDYDFLAQALPADNPGDRAVSPANVNAVWVVSNLHDLESPSSTLGLKARSLASSAEVNVGKFSIVSALKPLTPPSPDQLTAAGYLLAPNTSQDDASGGGSEAAPSGAGSGTSGSTTKHTNS
jgi:hypothetical protein